jgi:acyl dehydratase
MLVRDQPEARENLLGRPDGEIYWEDYRPGSMAEYGSISIDESDIIEFGRKFDPQVFHTDPERAARGPFHGLIASGLHTAGLMMRLFVDHHLRKVASLGSPGVDEMRFLLPVRPGDTLSVRVTVLDVRRSRSKPDRGTVVTFTEVLNQNRQVVMTAKALMIVRCRKQAE